MARVEIATISVTTFHSGETIQVSQYKGSGGTAYRCQCSYPDCRYIGSLHTEESHATDDVLAHHNNKHCR